VPVGSALIDISAGGDAGGRAPTSTVGTSSLAAVSVSMRPVTASTITAARPPKTFKNADLTAHATVVALTEQRDTVLLSDAS